MVTGEEFEAADLRGEHGGIIAWVLLQEHRERALHALEPVLQPTAVPEDLGEPSRDPRRGGRRALRLEARKRALEVSAGLVRPLRLQVRRQRRGPLGRSDERLAGLRADLLCVWIVGAGGVRVEIVRGDDLDCLVLVRARKREQELSRREVLRLALPPRDRLVGHPLDEVLNERVLAVLRRARIRLDREQLLAHERPEQGLELGVGKPGQRRQSLLRERLAHDGGILEQAPLLGGETVEPRRDQRVQGLGHLERADRPDRSVYVIVPLEQTAVEQHAYRLDRVERYA